MIFCIQNSCWHSYRMKKILLVMKVTTFLLLLAIMQVSANTFAQKITLVRKNITLDQFFREIRKQTGYNISYSDQTVDDGKTVDVDFKNTPLENALKQALEDQLLVFKINDKDITIQPKEPSFLERLADRWTAIDVRGVVRNEKGEALEAVTVTAKGENRSTTTDVKGEFLLKGVDEKEILVFSGINIETYEVKVDGKQELNVNVRTKQVQLQEVNVDYNTGYQKIPKERATGSFEYISKEKINRQGGANLLSRLDGIATSLFFDKREQSPGNSNTALGKVMIRGVSTFANSSSINAPLIILNNFPYEGDINNINPNDVENITVLKDAAAASIWGARAGNGVIVITTRQGKLNQVPMLSFNNNIQVTEKPDLFSVTTMSSSDFIDFEKFLFSKGAYNGDLSSTTYPALSPVVELLSKERLGTITSIEANKSIEDLRALDVRNDFDKYIYRSAVNQQYFASLTGGSNIFKYAFSGGYDKSLLTLQGDNSRRLTSRLDVTVNPIKKMEIVTGFSYANSSSKNNSIGELGSGGYNYRVSKAMYPYATFGTYDAPAKFAKDYRLGYTDTAGAGKLLDWNYRVLDELKNSDNSIRQKDLLLNFKILYELAKGISIDFSYQFEELSAKQRSYASPERYQARNYINLFTQISGNNVKNIVPAGGIMDFINSGVLSNSGRLNLAFNKVFNKHQIVAIGGAEVRKQQRTGDSQRLYGFNDQTYSFSRIDNLNSYPQYGKRGSRSIDGGIGLTLTRNNFISYYTNIAYTYDNRYTFSTSVRKDAANLFGVNTNNKWKPFWTVGGAWKVSNEKWYQSHLLSDLNLRATYGYQGNVNNTIPPYTVLARGTANNSFLNLPYASVSNAGNPDLSWETIRQINIGGDFSAFNRKINGSVDFYHKKSDNLILAALADITTGVGSVPKNSAGILGRGFDIDLSSKIIDREFKWFNGLGFSHVMNRVTKKATSEDDATVGGYATINGATISTIIGKSPYSVYSFPFAGLDAANGDPLGYNGKTVSKDYLEIFQQKIDTGNIIYHGSAIPAYFGFLSNTFRYRRFSIYVNLTYRFGYYFKKNTISYSNLISFGTTHADYAKRWQQPGDEKSTTVPSLTYPLTNSRRDDFYANSEVNVFKGDHVRLQNIRFSYTIDPERLKKIFVKHIELYGMIQDLGILWRANKANLDPDYDTGNGRYIVPRKITIGLRCDF